MPRQTFNTLHIEQAAEGVLLITLNRPSAGNSLSTLMALELKAVLDSVPRTPDVRAVVLTGAGEKIFCAGADLKERDGMTDAAWADQHVRFEEMRDSLRAAGVPVIAAVNGAAYGGGCEIALNCDFIYAATGARFALPEVKLGIMPGLGGVQNLVRAAGQGRAREILLTGDPFTAEDGVAWGIVNKAVPLADLVAEAVAAAAKIAANAPLSVRNIRQVATATANLDMPQAIEAELRAYNELARSEDRREGVGAWGEKRKPAWKGR